MANKGPFFKKRAAFILQLRSIINPKVAYFISVTIGRQFTSFLTGQKGYTFYTGDAIFMNIKKKTGLLVNSLGTKHQKKG